MFYAPFDSVVGIPQISSVLVADSTQRLPTGTLITATDTYWGTGEFIYGYAISAIRQYGICVTANSLQNGSYRTQMFEAATTGLSGRPICVAMAALAAGQFGWFCVTGLVPVNGAVQLTPSDNIGATTVGQIGVATAGRQLLNASFAFTSTATSVKAGCTGIAGQSVINIPNGEGWFSGVYLSGTGIGTGATVVSITPDQKQAVVSVVNSAAVSGNITATYNNGTVFYTGLTLNRPFLQGQIT